MEEVCGLKKYWLKNNSDLVPSHESIWVSLRTFQLILICVFVNTANQFDIRGSTFFYIFVTGFTLAKAVNVTKNYRMRQHFDLIFLQWDKLVLKSCSLPECVCVCVCACVYIYIYIYIYKLNCQPRLQNDQLKFNDLLDNLTVFS